MAFKPANIKAKIADGTLNPILYLPLTDPTAPGTNEGTGGDFTLNGTVALSGRGPNQMNVAASDFDGTNDYGSRAGLVGAADGKTVTLSVNVKLDAITGTQVLCDMGAGDFRASVVSGTLTFSGKNAGGTTVLDLTAGDLVAGRWHNIAASFNMANTSNRSVLVDGVARPLTVTTYTDDSFDLTTSAVSFAADTANANKLNGQIGWLWFDDTYIDLSASNPFCDTDTGKPKYLGVNGEMPTGTSPLIYLPLRGGDAGANKGTGGDFTVNSGPVTGARGPSEFWAESAEFNGTNQYLSRSNLIGVADSKVFSFAVAFYTDAIRSSKILNFDLNGTSQRFQLFFTSPNGDARLRAWNPSGTVVLDATRASAIQAARWYVMIGCIDLSNSANRYLSITPPGSAFSNHFTFTTYTNDNIDFTTTTVGVGAVPRVSPTDYMDGKIGFLWFDTTYIDFSQEANRLKFFDAFGYPVDVGADGSKPTGTTPLIYMNKGFHLGTNLGSGGNFTPINGPTDGGFVKG